jgi:hypothetical protein
MDGNSNNHLKVHTPQLKKQTRLVTIKYPPGDSIPDQKMLILGVSSQIAPKI